MKGEEKAISGLQDKFSFDDFKEDILKENNLFKKIVGTSLIFFILSVFLLLAKDQYVVSTYKKVLPNSIYLEEICDIAFKNLFITNPSEHLIHKSIIKDLEKSPMDFDLIKVLKIFKVDERICQVIVKTESGLRSFLVEFDYKNSYPFFYKLIAATEVAVYEHFQGLDTTNVVNDKGDL